MDFPSTSLGEKKSEENKILIEMKCYKENI